MSIKIAKTNKHLSANAGLVLTKELMKSTGLRVAVDTSLPRLNSGTDRSYRKFCDLILGLVGGADCIDDMEKLATDKAVSELSGGELYTAKAYGDFLRSFSALGIHYLQDALIKTAFQFRRNLFPEDGEFIFDADSTGNQQYGRKMEGVAKNYLNIDCLDSLDVFDSHGIQYFIDVRPGNTATSEGIEGVIHRLMSAFEQQRTRVGKKWRACFRADRGYYKSGFINACFAKGADVVVGVRQDEHYFPRIINQVHDWQATDLANPDRIKFYDGRECEIGTTRFRPQKFNRRMRYILMRARKETGPLFPDHIEYDYYAFCTSYDEPVKSAEEVIIFIAAVVRPRITSKRISTAWI